MTYRPRSARAGAVDSRGRSSPRWATVRRVRYERTGRGVEEVRVLEVTECPGCGNLFTPGRDYTRSWRNCMCTPGLRGHVIHCCLRFDCRAHTPEPACRGQHGPTADYGGVSTHRPAS